MPTAEEQDELRNNCDFFYEEYNGVSGWTVESRINGNSIFIPASGVKQEKSVVGAGQYCYMFARNMYYNNGGSYGFYYWSLNENNAKNDSFTRFTGAIVRPVWSSSTNPPSMDTTVVSGYENGYGYVDLGLSVKWAAYNVGAEKAEEYGDYYAWGETETKSSYTWTNYEFLKDGDSEDNVTFYKYNTVSNRGEIDNKTVLLSEDDVAQVKWGGNWRIPTITELDELQNNCNWMLTTMNGVYGYMVTSKKSGFTDRSIFLPYAGYCEGSSYLSLGECCRYWSSSLDSDEPCRAGRMAFGSPSVNWYSGRRSVGLSVRPVCPQNLSTLQALTGMLLKSMIWIISLF